MDLKEIHLEMMNIFKVFNQVCLEHELEYIICAGTLLGAVRHKGFIPWDDDFDVLMTRSDYDKLISVWVDQQSIKMIKIGDQGYIKVSTPLKIHNNNFRVEELWDVENGMPQYSSYGIFIDVFPLDKYPDNLIGKLLNKYIGKFLLGCEFSNYDNAMRPYYQRITLKLLKLIPNKITEKIRCKAIKYLSNLKLNDNFKYGYGVETPFNNLWIDHTSLYPLREYVFENTSLLGPNDSNEYLTQRFGDYMKMPSHENRISHIKSIIAYTD